MAKLNIKNGIIQDNSILGVPFRRGIVPIVTGKHRPGTKTSKSSVTIHNADNTSKTAGAENHRQYLFNCEKKPIPSQVSWHFVVDDKEIIQCVPITEVAYCQGNGNGNRTSISIEICDNQYNYDRAKYLKAEENAAKLAGSLLETLGISTIYQHYDWTKKNCPSKIRKEGRWNSYKAKINSYKGKSNSSTTGSTNTGNSTSKGDDFMSKFGKHAPMVISALNQFNDDKDYQEALRLLRGKFYPSYNPVVTYSGDFDYEGLKGKLNYIIGLGGSKGSHSSTINYFIKGSTGVEILKEVKKIRLNDMAYFKNTYKV